jgi:hypothetical protein
LEIILLDFGKFFRVHLVKKNKKNNRSAWRKILLKKREPAIYMF